MNHASIPRLEDPARPSWLSEREFPYTSRFIEVDGNVIHYVDEGQGPTLLFLHGLPLWSFEYRNVIRALRERFRCIAPDYPGFGLSVAAPGFRNGLSANVHLVETFVQQLNLRGITLVLHDVSTPIGIAVAERNPQSIRALVLANGFGFPLDEYRSVNAFVKCLGSRPFRLLAVGLNFFTWFTVGFLGSKAIRFLAIHLDPLLPRHPTTNIDQGQLSRAARRAYAEPFRNRSRRHHQTDLFSSVATGRDVLSEIERRSTEIAHIPTLIVFGDMDATYQLGWHTRLAAMFPRHRIDPIRGGHHFPQEYAPDQFTAAILRWYDDEVNHAVSSTEPDSMSDILRTPEDRFTGLGGYPFAPHYAEVDSLRIHYLDEGAPAADPILLLHGNLSWSYLYRRMIPDFAQTGHRVIAPDLVGFGRSDKPARRDDHTFERHVEWMRRLLEALKLRNITVVGHDWGGLIAQRLAAEHEGWFARIVATNTFLPDGYTAPTKALLDWKELSRTIPDLRPSEMVQRFTVRNMPSDVMAAYDAPFPDEQYKAGPRVFPILIPTSPDDPSVPANRAAWQVLRRWQKPFLTAFSDSDPVFSRNGTFSPDGMSPEEYLQRNIPGAKGQPHRTIANAGHFVQEDQGSELARVILDFVRATPLRTHKVA